MVKIAGHLKGDVECLRYCLVQDPQSVKPHFWHTHKFIIPTKYHATTPHCTVTIHSAHLFLFHPSGSSITLI